MEEWINLTIHCVAIGVEVCGAIVIVYGAGRTMYTYLSEHVLHHREPRIRPLRLWFARHLSLGLEFALAGDILKTLISPTWTSVGLLAGMIVLRTVLSFFLEREMEAIERKEECTRQPEKGESG